MLTKEEAGAQVAKGAALLDARDPGWATLIDVGMLDLGDSCGCILGQLDGDYLDGRNLLWPYRMEGCRRRRAREHGFQVADGLFSAVEDADYRTLRDAWIVAIADRLVPKSAPEPEVVHAPISR